MWDEFKKFAIRGNVIDLAVGLVLGAAFGLIVSSLVNNVLMPPLGLVIGGIDFKEAFLVLRQPTGPGPFHTAEEITKAGGVALQYGVFINAVINFIIVAFAMFLLVKGFNKLGKKPVEAPAAPTTKKCAFCKMEVPIDASRCGHCTSTLEQTA